MPAPLQPQSAKRLVRRLSARYLLVLVAVAALVGLDQIVVQPLLQRLGEFAPVINVSGRQRMLSQKLTKASLAFQAATTNPARAARRGELRSTLAEWVIGHHALRQGDPRLGIAHIQSPAIDQQWLILQPHWQAMHDAAQSLTVLDDSSTGATDEAETARLVNVVLEHEQAYLPTMDRIVKLFEEAAAHEVFRLRIGALAIGSAIIALLLILGYFVVRPAGKAIRSQVELLEARVAQRTEELDQANASLRHEIVERERAEANQQRLAAQLAHASRIATMGHLTAGLAHELNQPLAAIANFAEASDVLLSQSVTDEVRLRLHSQQIQQAALRAGQIVRGMRNFVRPQRGSPVAVDLNALVREVAEFCRPEMLHRGVDCRLQLTADPLLVNADRIQMQQVLVNLLQNAIDSLDDSRTNERRIEIHTFADEGAAQVEVADNGPGILDSDVAALFQPFRTTKANGLGIGLSISRSIVEQHQGRIGAKATAGGGATFYFSLPWRNEHDQPRPETSDSLRC